MKVVSAQAMQELDRQAVSECGITPLQLMENAGKSCAEVIVAEFGSKGCAVIMAGKGNNGGDGYVIARLLGQIGWDVNVVILADRDHISGEAALNLERLSGTIISYCTSVGQLTELQSGTVFQADLIVDALLGTGLGGDVGGIYSAAIDLINMSSRPVMAVDIPSGIHGTTGRLLGNAVRADITVTFALAKIGQVLYPGAGHVGRLVVADIGIPRRLMEKTPGFEFMNAEAMSFLPRRRDRQAHKGEFGHCLFLAGSTGKTGAAALTANSAVRAGSGLVTLGVAESIHHILEVKTTEAMTSPLPDSGHGHLTLDALPDIEKLLDGKDAVAIGPGLGNHPDTFALIRKLVQIVALPLVIDADGLNAVAEDIGVLKKKKPEQMILTPHPGEMARLLGCSVPDVEAGRIELAQKFAKVNGVYLVLKGSRTIIASPEGEIAINGSGNPGMATGGMGDVLTGIIASLLGQGHAAWDACRLGVFLHGFAADTVAAEKGESGITASDVIEKLPYAYNELLQSQKQPAVEPVSCSLGYN